MKFDVRQDSSPEKKEAFVAWLTAETVSTFQRAIGNPDALKTSVFLAINRAHEAGLTSIESAKIIGICVFRAGLSLKEEESVFDWLEALAPISEATHAKRGSKPNDPKT